MTEKGQTPLWRHVVMVLLAVVSILLIFVPEYTTLTEDQQRQLLYVDLAIVAIFWVEYLDRLVRATDRRAFVRANWYEIPGMVPILPGMEQWAGIRFFRLLRILRILRLVGALRRWHRFEQLVEVYVRRSKLGYLGFWAVTIMLVCAAGAWLAEPDTFQDSYWNAFWWALVTSFTVGYGDYYPVTVGGRIAGIVLMMLGIALIGTFAGTLGSFLVERRVVERAEETQRTEGGRAPHLLPVPGIGIASELEHLSELHRRGDLTDAEFEAAKGRLLSLER